VLSDSLRRVELSTPSSRASQPRRGRRRPPCACRASSSSCPRDPPSSSAPPGSPRPPRRDRGVPQVVERSHPALYPGGLESGTQGILERLCAVHAAPFGMTGTRSSSPWKFEWRRCCHNSSASVFDSAIERMPSSDFESRTRSVPSIRSTSRQRSACNPERRTPVRTSVRKTTRAWSSEKLPRNASYFDRLEDSPGPPRELGPFCTVCRVRVDELLLDRGLEDRVQEGNVTTHDRGTVP
jgi:hypothetical protein